MADVQELLFLLLLAILVQNLNLFTATMRLTTCGIYIYKV